MAFLYYIYFTQWSKWRKIETWGRLLDKYAKWYAWNMIFLLTHDSIHTLTSCRRITKDISVIFKDDEDNQWCNAELARHHHRALPFLLTIINSKYYESTNLTIYCNTAKINHVSYHTEIKLHSIGKMQCYNCANLINLMSWIIVNIYVLLYFSMGNSMKT